MFFIFRFKNLFALDHAEATLTQETHWIIGYFSNLPLFCPNSRRVAREKIGDFRQRLSRIEENKTDSSVQNLVWHTPKPSCCLLSNSEVQFS